MLNRTILTGRLVRDPELRKIGATGNSVCNFTLAVDNWEKTIDGNHATSFIPCVVWGKPAENTAKYARKGLLVGVDGRLVQRTYDRKDGTKASIIEVNCESVQFLESKVVKEPAETTIDPNETHEIQNMDNDAIAVADDKLPF